MLRFWYIETLVASPDSWYTEPWFEDIECYRDWSVANQFLENKAEEYRDLEEFGWEESLARWNKLFGGHAPPMPRGLTVCRLVEARGQAHKVGAISGRKFTRAEGAPVGRPWWGRDRKTFFVVADPEPGRRRYLSRTEWPYLPDGLIAYRTQRKGIERAKSERWRGLILLRVDARLTPRRRLAVADLPDDPDER